MALNHNPLMKIRGAAKGVAYTGFASHWRCDFGDVIIIAKTPDALEVVSLKMKELKKGQGFDMDLCPQVAVFHMNYVEVA